MMNDVTRWQTLSASVALLFAVACSSDADSPQGKLPEGAWLGATPPEQVLASSMCATPSPGTSPLRRLTNAEYKNTLIDLGLDEAEVTATVAALPSETESLGFRNGASALTVNSLLAQKYQAIAREYSRKFAGNCAGDEASCADQFVTNMGLLLHRRPLSEDEKASYLGIFEKSRAFDEVPDAYGWVIEAMLQSPYFLYRVELPGAEVQRVTGFEMASRLSYTFWQAPPDEELRNAARDGLLETPEQIQAQALRLLADERAFRLYEFFEQWLDLDELRAIERDPILVPNVPAQLPELLKAESRAFIQHLLADPNSTFTDLLSAKYTFANQGLAAHYGLQGPAGDVFERVDAPQRSGVLTQGMLAVRDTATHTSIVRRGLKVRTDFLCQTVPAPPNNVDLTLDGIGKDLTQAEKLAIHREQPSCNKCHTMMDPLGIAFEEFDTVGRFRTTDEYGSPLTTAGEIAGTLDADGPVNNVHDVAAALSESIEAQQCYMIQNFRFFFGREARREDLCSQAQLSEVFSSSNQSLVEMLVGLAETDAFLYKAPLQVEAAAEGDAQ